MLLHAFFARADAGRSLVLPPPVTAGRGMWRCCPRSHVLRPRRGTVEQFKHLAAADAGPLAGLGVLPGLRALRSHLARIADAADPVAVQAMFASAMLAADPVTSGSASSMTTSSPIPGRSRWQGVEQQAGPGRTGPRGHPRHRARRPGGVLRDRGTVRAEPHAAEGAGRAEESRRARREDHARLRPRRRLPAGIHALPRPAGALGELPAGTAGGPGHAAGHHRGHRRRADPADRLGRGDRAGQGLGRSPADHLVRVRQDRPADPDLGL